MQIYVCPLNVEVKSKFWNEIDMKLKLCHVNRVLLYLKRNFHLYSC